MPSPSKRLRSIPWHPRYGHKKAGGRVKGTPNKAKIAIMRPDGSPPIQVIISDKTPKDVMVKAMMWFIEQRVKGAHGVIASAFDQLAI